MAELGDEEPVATMRFSEGLPSLPGLAGEWTRDQSLQPIVDQWTESWDRADGIRARSEAIGAAAPLLVDRMPEGEVARVVASIDRALGEVETILLETEVALSGPIEEAMRAQERARAALDSGDEAAALVGTLTSADHLRMTTPDALARLLVEQGEEALRRIEREDSYPEVNRERAMRLLVGAREALGGGNASLALRRAWYAVGLLDPDAIPATAPSPEPEVPES